MNIKANWNFIPPVALLGARALCHLATQPGVTTTASTAAALGCSMSYMEQVFGELRRAGFIQSQRGPGGGFTLARKPDAITLSDLIEAFVEEHQRLPAALETIRDQLAQVLSSTNLKQLMEAS